MRIIYFASVLLFSMSLIASDIIYVSDHFLYTIKNKSFSEFIQAIDHTPINAFYKSSNFGSYPPNAAATILEHVCSYGKDDTEKFKKVQWLVEHDAIITDQTVCNVAKLHHADDVEIMNYLLSKGGNSNSLAKDSQCDKNTSAVHHAIYADFFKGDKTSMIELLLNAGADVHSTKAPYCNTPLLYAAKHSQNPFIIKLLLAHGAQIDAENSYKENILHIAVKKSTSVPVIKTILKHTSLPLANKKEFYYEETPLHIAARNVCNPQNIIALLKCPQIDIEIQNSNYAGKQTALQLAKGYQHKTTGRILIRFKTLKQLLSQPTWGDPINHLPVPIQIPEKLLIHHIAYLLIKQEFLPKK